MKNYDLYIFDFDGTLFNTEKSLALCYQKSYKIIGIEIKNDEIRHLMQQNLKTGFDEKGVPEQCRLDLINYFNHLQEEKETIGLIDEFADVKNTLYKLKASGKQIAIVSGNSEKHIRNVLSYFNFDTSLFSTIVGYESFKKPKPDGEPLLVGLEKLDYLDKKNKAIYIGDSPHDDLQCAGSAGIDGLLIDRSLNQNDLKNKRIFSLLELAKF